MSIHILVVLSPLYIYFFFSVNPTLRVLIYSIYTLHFIIKYTLLYYNLCHIFKGNVLYYKVVTRLLYISVKSVSFKIVIP